MDRGLRVPNAVPRPGPRRYLQMLDDDEDDVFDKDKDGTISDAETRLQALLPAAVAIPFGQTEPKSHSKSFL